MDITRPDIKSVWTIGHSRHSAAAFRALLETYAVRHLVDIRSLPGSHRYLQLNEGDLAASLPPVGVGYTHIGALVGRQGAAFYIDYMANDLHKSSV